MKPTKNTRRQTYLSVAITLLAAVPAAHAATTLISHTFDGPGGTLSGDALDVNNVSASTWNAAAAFNENGNVTLNNPSGGATASANIDLGAGTISMGGVDDIYTLEYVASLQTGGTQILTLGFLPSASTTASHDNQGSPWSFWRASTGELRGSTGKGFSGDLGTVASVTRGVDHTFTFVLTLTNATLSNNSVQMFVDGTAVGPATNFSGDEVFRYVGIGANTFNSTQTLNANIKSMSLTQVPEPNSALLAGGFSLLALLRRRRNG